MTIANPLVAVQNLEELYRHGFRRMLVLNGHGGNNAPLQCVFSDLANRYLQLALLVAVGLAAIGAVDDLAKLCGRANGISRSQTTSPATVRTRSRG